MVFMFDRDLVTALELLNFIFKFNISYFQKKIVDNSNFQSYWPTTCIVEI
jgi:hypothetical protein